MENQRKLIRLDVGDFLEIRALDNQVKKVKAQVKDFSLMGVCFSSEMEWKKDDILLIDYFIPQELDSVLLKIIVKWSEFIDAEQGYFCGGEVIEVEEKKMEKFASYYYQRLKERFL
ncbi:MAG: hypothetical protein PHV17_07715 [Candidatus Omnitrophica bacterium]|nr:hypothetical protein [Candidatus Omnitrophota bacterium]